MRTIGVGFIGLGGICRHRHVPGLKRIPGIEFVAVANRTRESSMQAAEECGVKIVCKSWELLLTREDIDAVVIGTWPYMHREMSLAALAEGKHVFCQARMAMNLDEAREMRAAAAASGLVAMLCPVPIGLKYDATVLRMIAEGDLGEVRLVRTQSFASAFATPAAPATWRKDHRLSGLNMHTLGMYAEVLHRWFGWTRSVSAQMDIFTPERKDAAGESLAIEIPDQVLLNMRMRSGVTVQSVFSSAVYHGQDSIEIYGSKGTLRYNVDADLMEFAPSDGGFEPVMQRPDELYDVKQWRVESDFVAAMRKGTEYHPNFEDGYRYMQVVQAAYESQATGRTVTLSEE
jgi:predicted dehydrogenase